MQLSCSHHPVDFIIHGEHNQTVVISKSAVKSTMHNDARFSKIQDLGQSEEMHQKFE